MKNPLYVASVGKAFRVLDCFTTASRELSLTDIMAHSDLDKSAAQRYAFTLCAEGYLEQDARTRRYRLGKRVLDLTFHFLRTHALVESLNPILLDLSVACGERISLSLVDGNELVHVMRHQSRTEHYHASLIGRRVPLFCTAGGRAVLAQYEEDVAESLLSDQERTAYTARTQTSIPDILAALRVARTKGYAMVVDEFIYGEVALGAAICDEHGAPFASLHISGSTRQWSSEEYAARFSPHLLAAISQVRQR